jgi:transmembrane sensor
MDLSDLDWERLERYVSRRATPEELAELERWVQASPELIALADAMRAVGQVPAQPVHSWDADTAWHRVSRRMRWLARPTVGPSTRRALHDWVPWSVAAVLILAVGSTLLVVESRSRAERERVAAAGSARQVVTRRGERATFTLADGSRVMLGPETRLTIPVAYKTGGRRELYLDGEGYFEVVHDTLHPFQVNTPLGTAEDLGTEFVVSTYPEARGMRVVVASGKVALRQRPLRSAHGAADSRPLLTLLQGDLARLDSAGTATVTRVDPLAYVAWTQGALAFNGTSLRDALPQLARWYDLNIRLADSALGARRLTATFREQSAAQVLDLIALSLDLRMEREGRVVILYPSPVHRPS